MLSILNKVPKNFKLLDCSLVLIFSVVLGLILGRIVYVYVAIQDIQDSTIGGLERESWDFSAQGAFSKSTIDALVQRNSNIKRTVAINYNLITAKDITENKLMSDIHLAGISDSLASLIGTGMVDVNYLQGSLKDDSKGLPGALLISPTAQPQMLGDILNLSFILPSTTRATNVPVTISQKVRITAIQQRYDVTSGLLPQIFLPQIPAVMDQLSPNSPYYYGTVFFCMKRGIAPSHISYLADHTLSKDNDKNVLDVYNFIVTSMPLYKDKEKASFSLLSRADMVKYYSDKYSEISRIRNYIPFLTVVANTLIILAGACLLILVVTIRKSHQYLYINHPTISARSSIYVLLTLLMVMSCVIAFWDSSHSIFFYIGGWDANNTINTMTPLLVTALVTSILLAILLKNRRFLTILEQVRKTVQRAYSGDNIISNR